ncbi:MAG: guanylate kinase [Pirellulaceae bacterium]
MSATANGKLVIFSGPSGAGKSTVLKQLLKTCRLPLQPSVSATTRAPRHGERNGVEYHFLSKEAFARRRENGEFLECKEVYGRGDWYGTLKETVASGLASGKWVVLEIDVQGAVSVLETYPEAITVFVHSGSLEALEHRLRQRGTESEESTQRRLEVARAEMALMSQYTHEVNNQVVSQAADEIYEILNRYAET